MVEDCVRGISIMWRRLERWREMAEDGGKWRSIMIEAGQKTTSGQWTSPLIKGRECEDDDSIEFFFFLINFE